MSNIIRRRDLPTVCINLLTKNRTQYATATVKKCLDNLKYEGNLVWYISDGGSQVDHLAQLGEILNDLHVIIGNHSVSSNPGSCWNIGLGKIFEKGIDIYLRLEDDMVLKDYLDITTYVKLLMTNPMVGMVRLGQIVIDLDMATFKHKTYTHVGYTEEVYLHVKPSRPYCFSGHPALIHKRFHDIYGFYPTNLSPGETEVAMDEQVRRGPSGPIIVYPWDMGKYGTWGIWDHIGKESST